MNKQILKKGKKKVVKQDKNEQEEDEIKYLT